MRVEAAIAELAKWLPDLLAQVRPDPVLYDAGVDPHRDDALGKLALTDAGLLRRDRYVLEECVRRGVPVATVIGGGYSKDMDANCMGWHWMARPCVEPVRTAKQSTW